MINWSDEQQAIFEFFASGTGNLVVRARAGTGKTTSIIEGISRSSATKIILCAFNKRIAVELTNKLRNPNAQAKTLHSLGFKFVTRNWNNVRLDDGRAERIVRTVCDNEAPDAIVRLICRLASLAKGAMPYPNVDDLVDLSYEHDIVPDEEWVEDGWTSERIAELAIKCMDRACVRDGTIDFDDMVFVPVRNKWIRGTYDLVVVDEAQDMNACQLLLAQKIVSKGGRIVVVGDDRQAIYGFRGADSNSLDRLKKELGAKELGLKITRRCPKSVVAHAATIVPDFRAADDAPEGTIMSIGHEALVKVAEPGDFVISRKNAPLAGICLAFLRAGKKAKIQGRDIGKGLINLVKKIKGKSLPDFLAKLARWEEREIKRLVATGKKSAETRIEFVKDQAQTLIELSAGLSGVKELLVRVETLFTDVDNFDNVIVCSSVHKAKGLEADNVFLIEKTFMRGSKANIEERNVEYVAVTRAKKTLTWIVNNTSV